jgi:tRNA pseudouridine38-40 synthase
MRQIKLTLQYDGTAYSGWQVQDNQVTIQGLLEDAIFKVTGERIRIAGASRTDAGVHAFAQVAVFKTGSILTPQVFLRAINANIPQDIQVINAEESFADFHPRYSAKHKTYSYLISRAGDYSGFLRRYSWQTHYQLNSDLMRVAADYLTGTHDFSSFRASGCGAKDPVRTIMKIEVSELPSIDFMSFKFNVPLIKISIQANAFLRHMVRNIVGMLVEIGRGRHPASQMKEVLSLKDRCLSGPTAPANGLFLEEINY